MPELTIEQLKEFAEIYSDLLQKYSDTGALNIARASTEAFSDALDRAKISAASAAEAARGLGETLPDNAIDKAKRSMNELFNSFKDTAAGAVDANDRIRRFGAGLAGAIAIASGKLDIPDELIRLTNTASDATAQLSDMSSTIGKLAPKTGALGKMASALGTSFMRVAKASDFARNLETSLLRAAAAGGDMAREMNEMGGAMDDPRMAFQGLADRSARFIALTTEIATANNVSAASAQQYAQELMRIPGAMRETVDTGSEAAGSLHMLDAVLKVSAGTFQEVKTVMGDVNTLFQTFRSSGEDSLSVISRMHSAAQAFQVPMDNMRSAVKTAADQFKFLGDNSQTAITIMSRFSEALRGSGVGPRAVQELTQGFTGLMSQMDMAQRAFVSAQTGGPGGLQGAYQMRLEMREPGGGERVAQRIEDTLRQMMGGRLVTMEEAAMDPRAAAQMAKQVQMLTTGPLQVAQTEGQAERIVEAMARGRLFEAGEEMAGGVPGPEQALQQAVDTGNEIQQQQQSTLLSIHNELQRQSEMAGVYIEDARRILEGPRTRAGEFVAGQRQEAQVVAAEFTDMPEEAGGVGVEQDRTMDLIGRGMEGVGRMVDTMSRRAFGEEPMAARPQPPRPAAVGEPARVIRGAARQEEDLFGVGPVPEALRQYEERKAREAGRAAPGATAARAEPAAGGQDNTVIIKVMDEREIQKMIKVFFDKRGRMHVAEAYGMPGG